MADDRLIVALDVSTMDAMKSIVSSLGDSVSFLQGGHGIILRRRRPKRFAFCKSTANMYFLI